MTHLPKRSAVARRLRPVPWVGVAVLVLAALFIGGCGSGNAVPPVNVQRPATAQKPAAADLSTPESAVRSYLDYVTYAYRLGNSDVASRTMAPQELARVASYIGYDKDKGQTIDQHLVAIKFGTSVPASDTSGVLVPAHEEWTYRYVDNTTGGFKGAEKTANLDATYTVAPLSSLFVPWRTPGEEGWLVAGVEATSSALAK